LVEVAEHLGKAEQPPMVVAEAVPLNKPQPALEYQVQPDKVLLEEQLLVEMLEQAVVALEG
jgi:hypothetical protein